MQKAGPGGQDVGQSLRVLGGSWGPWLGGPPQEQEKASLKGQGLAARLPNSCRGPPVGDEGEGSRQPPSPRLSPRAAPPAAPGSASRATIAGRGGAGGAPPGRGGAPLGLVTRGAAGRPPSSASGSRSAPAPAPARAASRGLRQCLIDVLAAAAPRCRLGVVVSGSATHWSVPSPPASRARLRALGRSEECAWAKEFSREDKPGLRPSLGRRGPDAWRRRGREVRELLTDPARAAAQGPLFSGMNLRTGNILVMLQPFQLTWCRGPVGCAEGEEGGSVSEAAPPAQVNEGRSGAEPSPPMLDMAQESVSTFT
nr:vasodilator-stimulated phosphoprotein-like [Kogia breviceps]